MENSQLHEFWCKIEPIKNWKCQICTYFPTCPGCLHLSCTRTYHMETSSIEKQRDKREFFLMTAIVEVTCTFQEQWRQQSQWWHEVVSATSSAIWGIQSLFNRDSSNDLTAILCYGSSCLVSLCSCTFSKAGSIQPSTNVVSHSMSFLLNSTRLSFHCSQLRSLMDTLRT